MGDGEVSQRAEGSMIGFGDAAGGRASARP